MNAKKSGVEKEENMHEFSQVEKWKKRERK